MKELTTIQARLKAPKNNKNTFGGYNYRKCEDILEAAKPIYTELNCALFITDEIVLVGDRIYVKATATLTNAEGQCVSCSAFAREEETKKGMDMAQITGSASSYARKYALNGLFAIDDTKDPDELNTHGKESTAPQPHAPQPHKKTITDAHFEDKEKCDALMLWLHSKYDIAENKEKFNAGVCLSRFYNISEDNMARANEVFKFYLKNKK